MRDPRHNVPSCTEESIVKPMLSRLPAIFLICAAVFAAPVLAADASVDARLKASGIPFEVDGDGDYKVTYSYTEDNRTQLVFVSGRTEQVGGIEVREIFSPAARVAADSIDGAKALALLAESRTKKIGGWELSGDVLYFVIKLPDTVDAAGLEAAMDIAAETADNKELELSGDKDDL
ncbi:hypothetical protein [Pseudoxanthomonas sp. PXM01]|uniref:hypothetical protein n=1 Tax=Pseudoxanthomonas sp. PXM01 TaxID=2769295 RepID=UPI001784A50B|nr:hypothetical protein [Pseudoxanthomonas sp. PXM01]MBD9467797.1 hypothetical protein [Pseudoxanthomonas sp. PXM01]